MRTTLALDDAVLGGAKKRALDLHMSLAKFVEAAVREKLQEDVREVATLFRALRTAKGDGLQVGVDLNDSKSLAEAMD